MARRKYKLLVLIREDDEMEFPVFVAESVQEMSRETGISAARIYYSMRTERFIEDIRGLVRVIDCTEGE